MPTVLRQQKYPFGSLRKDSHWSMQGLMFYSQFKPAGKLIDETSYKNDGVITGGVWRSKYLFMDGTGVVRTVADNPPISDWPITIITYGRVTTLVSNDFYFSISKSSVDDHSIVIRLTDGKLEGAVFSTLWNPTTQAAGTVAVGDDIMAAYVCASSTDRKLYLNGQLVASDTDADAFPDAPTNMAWGGLVRSTEIYAPGEFSGTNIYNRGLSATEILELYANPDLPMQQYLAWWGKAPAVGVTIPIMIHHYKQAGGL